jgi:hypothetical protein
MADLYFLRQTLLQATVLLERSSDRFLRLQNRLQEIENELESSTTSAEGGIWKERKRLKQSRHKANKELQICRAEVENLLRASHDIKCQIETAEAMQRGQIISPPIATQAGQQFQYRSIDYTTSPISQYAHYPPGMQWGYPVSGYAVQSPTFGYQVSPTPFGYTTQMYTPQHANSTFKHSPVRPPQKAVQTPITNPAAKLFDSSFDFNKPAAKKPSWPSIRPSVALPVLDINNLASSPPPPTDESPKRFGPEEAARLPPPDRRYSAAAVDLLLYRFKTNEKNDGHRRMPHSDPQVNPSPRTGIEVAAPAA